MKILIVGSMGFIGNHLEKYFTQTAHEVYGCDVIDSSNQKNYVKVDANVPDFEMLFKNNQYDVCINCSGAADVSRSFDTVLYDFELNAFNVGKILNGIKNFNTKCKFVNISSAAVYGNPVKLPISEKDKPAPVSPYGYHKLISETILEEYYKLWGIKTCSARIFSAYGNGLKKQLLYDISKKIKTQSEVHLFGSGRETRDFIHIDDICSALDCIVKKDGFESSKINIANGAQVSIGEIVKIFNEYWQHGKKIIFDGIGKQGDPVNWQADISMLNSYGYRQSVSMQDGVRGYINWIQSEK